MPIVRETGCKWGTIVKCECVAMLASTLYRALEDVFFSPVLEDAVFQRGEGLSGVYWVEHELLSGYVAGIVTQATKNRADS